MFSVLDYQMMKWSVLGYKPSYLLKVFDELVEAHESPKPRVMVVRLDVHCHLLCNSRPLGGVIMLDHVTDAHSQLDPTRENIKMYIKIDNVFYNTIKEEMTQYMYYIFPQGVRVTY